MFYGLMQVILLLFFYLAVLNGWCDTCDSMLTSVESQIDKLNEDKVGHLLIYLFSQLLKNSCVMCITTWKVDKVDIDR